MNQVEENNDGSYVLNIQPKASVLSVFSRLNYKPWYAIAEFVDNSTQSFYNHEKELAKVGINSVNVVINYNFEKNILTIRDDAFGMNLDEFSRAVQMDVAPEDKTGRNEFGMGLKTAASWFGNKWTVVSTRYGEPYTYSTDVDIPALKASETNTIKISKTPCKPQEHGTVIIIQEITKKIDSGRTKGKIMDILESMYRRDLNSGKVNISFGDTALHFENYTCLSFREQTWKKNVSFSFDFDEKTYRVKGFVGILAEGGFGKAGFALFRRGRVVIGGTDMNYKPNEIFGQPQGPISHKLFGELDLDTFPVNQAKDGFVWDNGLEECFIDHLKENIQEYINIAKLTVKEREKEESLSKKTSESVKSAVESFVNNISLQNGNPSLFEKAITNPEEFSDEVIYKQFLESENNKPTIISDSERKYTIQINDMKKKDFIVKWAIGNNDYWINLDDSKKNEVTVVININHSFFKPYSNNEEFKVVLEKFVLAFVVAEQLAKETSDSNGYIKASLIRNKMNSYLSQIQGE